MKFFQEYGWVIDFIAMAFMLFIVGIAITIYVVPPNAFLIALTIVSVLSVSLPFMVYRHDESGVRESVIIAAMANVVRKLLSIPKPKPIEQIITRKT